MKGTKKETKKETKKDVKKVSDDVLVIKIMKERMKTKSLRQQSHRLNLNRE